MKTTELYVEQVFVGLFIIFIALLPWLPEIACTLAGRNGLASIIASGSVVIAIAFILGIPFDRLSDTLSERLDKLQRLSFAIQEAKCSEQSNKKAEGPFDFYPEDKLLLRCLGDKTAITDRYDYLRSRIRLTRAMAVYGPALTLTVTAGVARWSELNPCIWAAQPDFARLFGGMAGAYVLWIALVLWTSRKGSRYYVPRTDERLDPKLHVQAGKGDLSIWAHEWPTWIVPLLLLVLAFAWPKVAKDIKNSDAALVAAAVGTALTVLSAWTWWRISNTHRNMLLQYKDGATAPAAKA